MAPETKNANYQPLYRQLLGRWEAADIAPLISLAVLIVFFSFAAPGFLGWASLSLILKQGSILLVVSVGLTFVLLSAEIDLSVGMMAVWASSLCGWLFDHYFGGGDATTPDPSAVAVTLCLLTPLVTCLLLGFGAGVLTVFSRLPSFIITLAMMFIAEGMALYLTKSEKLDVPEVLGQLGNQGIELTEAVKIPYSNAILAGLVLLIGHLVLQHTRFGRYVYMTGGNREAARLAGIRTGWIVIACLAICAVTAGLGGLINAGRMTSATADQNKDLLLSAVACVVLGGTSLFGGQGSMGRTLIGVLTYTSLYVGLLQIEWIDDLARQLLTGVVLLGALVINGVLSRQSNAS
jgi:ribose transport system permease protein